MDVSFSDKEQRIMAEADRYEARAIKLRHAAWALYTARHGMGHLIVSTFATPEPPPVWLN